MLTFTENNVLEKCCWKENETSLGWILIDGFSLFLIIWLSFFFLFVAAQAAPGDTLYLRKLTLRRDSKSSVFFFWFFFMSCICARTCFMVNKRAFFLFVCFFSSRSTKVSQPLIRSPVAALRRHFGRWILADRPTFLNLGSVSHSHTFEKAACLLPLTTLYSSAGMGQQQPKCWR